MYSSSVQNKTDRLLHAKVYIKLNHNTVNTILMNFTREINELKMVMSSRDDHANRQM